MWKREREREGGGGGGGEGEGQREREKERLEHYLIHAAVPIPLAVWPADWCQSSTWQMCPPSLCRRTSWGRKTHTHTEVCTETLAYRTRPFSYSNLHALSLEIVFCTFWGEFTKHIENQRHLRLLSLPPPFPQNVMNLTTDMHANSMGAASVEIFVG